MIALPALAHALLSGRCWRINRLIRWTVEMIGASHRPLADQLLDHHTEDRNKRAFMRKYQHQVQ